MSVRELLVLGTASQVPTRYRNHNGYLLRWDGHCVLFDPGEGTQRQMSYTTASASDITQIAVTHFHGDHCLGLPGIIQRLSLDGVDREIPVHFPASGEVFYERLRHASIFFDAARIEPRPITGDGVIFESRDLAIETRRLDHPVDTYGFRLCEPDGRRMLPEALAARGVRGPDIGRLQRQGSIEVDGATVTLDEVSERRRGQIAAFVMDTRPCDAALALARDADLLICESTYLDADRELADRAGHMTARQAAELAREAGARRLVLTHFSQRYPDNQVFADEAAAIHADCHAPVDGDVIAVPPRR